MSRNEKDKEYSGTIQELKLQKSFPRIQSIKKTPKQTNKSFQSRNTR